MHEEQPRVEILSRNRVNRSTIIVAIVPISVFTGLAAIALWPYLSWIAYGLLAVLFGLVLFLAALAVIEVRRRWLASPVIHVGEFGVVDAEAWRILPMQLPLPMLPAEKPAGMDPDHWRILQLAGKGMDLRSVALACNTTYYQVQKITSQWNAQVKRQALGDQSLTAS